ncbi:MAG: hypothetical protein HON65_14250 [Rhodospirillales bacterium]|nr:hypothetical protein [Rhodospirillales bacterium]
MSEKNPQKPVGLKRGEARKLARQQREAKSLRDNLLRRKQQNRSRGQKIIEPDSPDENNPGA